MTTREQAWQFARQAKQDLRNETDHEKRNKIAIWGLEMQELASVGTDVMSVYGHRITRIDR